MDLQQLAEKYINDHNNPITKKVELFGSKLFLSPLSEQQARRKEKYFADVKTSLEHDRVDRRVARSVAEWLPEQNMAKVTKFTRVLANFGTQNKNGKFLSAEEALFLLEINKLELVYNKTPIRIEEAYKNVKCLKKYLAFKNLALHGCKLKVSNLNGAICRKPVQKGEKSDEPPTKIARISEQVDNVAEVLERLRQNAPRTFKTSEGCKKVVDYCVNMPSSSETLKPFNLIVGTNKDYLSNVDEENCSIFALTSDGDVSFYKFYNANIPSL